MTHRSERERKTVSPMPLPFQADEVMTYRKNANHATSHRKELAHSTSTSFRIGYSALLLNNPLLMMDIRAQ